ncbi:MAG: BON domain-containing protein [Deltaproteobacteria bacterium]|nr:BON domain-containing protein [Deltaproteobacteria bacterium]
MIATFHKRLTLIVLMLSLVAAGCQALTGQTVGQNIDDSNLTAYVKAKLTADKAVNFTRVGVKTVRGTVYLTGTVDSPDQKARAGQLAGEVQGVKDVVNNLQIAQR